MEDIRARLNKLETQLKRLGVKDIKFAFGSIDNTPLSKITSDVIDVLELVIKGGLKDLPTIEYINMSKALKEMPDGSDINDLDEWAFKWKNTIRKALQQPDNKILINALNKINKRYQGMAGNVAGKALHDFRELNNE